MGTDRELLAYSVTRDNGIAHQTPSVTTTKQNMTAIGDAILLVILWSLTWPAVVSGQCTATVCGAGQQSNWAFTADDDSRYQSELDVVKLQLQLMAEKLGLF